MKKSTIFISIFFILGILFAAYIYVVYVKHLWCLGVVREEVVNPPCYKQGCLAPSKMTFVCHGLVISDKKLWDSTKLLK